MLLWGGVIRFIKGPLCAGHLLEEGISLEGGLGIIGSILQMKKLGLRNTKKLVQGHSEYVAKQDLNLECLCQ